MDGQVYASDGRLHQQVTRRRDVCHWLAKFNTPVFIQRQLNLVQPRKMPSAILPNWKPVARQRRAQRTQESCPDGASCCRAIPSAPEGVFAPSRHWPGYLPIATNIVAGHADINIELARWMTEADNVARCGFASSSMINGAYHCPSGLSSPVSIDRASRRQSVESTAYPVE